MLKSYRVGGSQCLCGGASVYVVAHKILVSTPVPLGFFGTLNWVGLVWGWVWGLKDLGLGLDNMVNTFHPLEMSCCWLGDGHKNIWIPSILAKDTGIPAVGK